MLLLLLLLSNRCTPLTEAITQLLLSVSDKKTFGIIYVSRTTEKLEGCLMTAWEKLERKFLPRMSETMIKLVCGASRLKIDYKKMKENKIILEMWCVPNAFTIQEKNHFILLCNVMELNG